MQKLVATETSLITGLPAMLNALLSVEEPLVTLFANAAAFIYDEIPRVNWVGFYFLNDDRLYLGPFIGKPACTILEIGKGVCSQAVTKRQTIVVADVNEFPGHVTCDAASRSEIVLAIILTSGRIIGVLDLDSAELNRFSEEDRVQLEQLRDTIVTKLDAMVLGDANLFV